MSPPRQITRTRTIMRRETPHAVIYDLSKANQVTITVPISSNWTSGLHWHESHTEYLQILQGKALVTLGRHTKEYNVDDGPIEVRKGMVHEWRRVPQEGQTSQDNDDIDLVVREWTVPSDGQKEIFFRMINSVLTESQPQQMYSMPVQLPTSAVLYIEQWVVMLQLFMIFRRWDNWPVFVGRDTRWSSWIVTHFILGVASCFGWLLGLRSLYEEYVSTQLAAGVQ